MKVILKQDLRTLGQAGEVVDVSGGHARNYLLPGGLAIKATQGAMADAEAMARARRSREAQNHAEALERKAELERTPVQLSANADDEGTLYGSVGSTAIARAVRDQLGVALEKKRVQLPQPLKQTGTHQVDLQVHGDVHASLSVEVTPA